MDDNILNGRNVLVHCDQGVSRSGSIVISYLMKSLNLSFKDARKLARKSRSAIRPNDGFIKQLMEFEQQEYIKKIKQSGGKKKKKMRTSVNKQFISDLKILLRIAVPSLWSKEVLYMLILAFFLVVRTILSIRIADVNGTIVKAIVRKEFWTVLLLHCIYLCALKNIEISPTH